MENEEVRKIVREEVRSALKDLFSEKRLSDMEENLQPEESSQRRPRRIDHPIDRLAFYTDRLAFLSMKLEDWGSDCECKYSISDIKHIKGAVDKL